MLGWSLTFSNNEKGLAKEFNLLVITIRKKNERKGTEEGKKGGREAEREGEKRKTRDKDFF